LLSHSRRRSSSPSNRTELPEFGGGVLRGRPRHDADGQKRLADIDAGTSFDYSRDHPASFGWGLPAPTRTSCSASRSSFQGALTLAEPGSSSGLSPPLRRTVHLLQLPPVSLSPFSCLRVALRPYE